MADRSKHDRIGSALHALAADLVTERRRVLALERENKQLKAQLDVLRCHIARSDTEPDDQALSRPDRPTVALTVDPSAAIRVDREVHRHAGNVSRGGGALARSLDLEPQPAVFRIKEAAPRRS
jgi:hypothetical protein